MNEMIAFLKATIKARSSINKKNAEKIGDNDDVVVDNQPEEQKAEIDEKEKGKEQSDSRQQCKMLWRQMVRVSYSHHQNDRSDIGACYHPYGENLDSVKHFPNLFLT